MTDKYSPAFDGRIGVEILDTETGERVKLPPDHSPYWWAEGNGSCDCNRRLLAFPDLDDAAFEAGEEQGCIGSKRFLIVATEGDTAGCTLWGFNTWYPTELAEKHLGVAARQAFEAEEFEREIRTLRGEL